MRGISRGGFAKRGLRGDLEGSGGPARELRAVRRTPFGRLADGGVFFVELVVHERAAAAGSAYAGQGLIGVSEIAALFVGGRDVLRSGLVQHLLGALHPVGT